MAEYLNQLDRPTEKIRCPVHGFIQYSKNERAVIDHSAFRRLKGVKQLALTHYVYPGAMHSRFEHSLGVMHLATRAFDTLAVKHESKIIAELAKLPELQQQTLAKSRQVVRLLALLHDVGHPAFSHAAESVLPATVKSHEDVSIFVIGSILKEVLEERFFVGITDLLIKLMEKKPEVTFLRQFVVSEMDMDRTDYLRRDSLHCGVDYGHFDLNRMIEALTVIENPETKQVQIGLERGGEHIFEALILARYQMNTQVYLHRLRRIYDKYLTAYVSNWGVAAYTDAGKVLDFDDMDVLVQMKIDAKTDGPRREVARRIIERDHHKMVYETGDSADAMKQRAAKKVFEAISGEYADVEFIADFGSASIHKQIVPSDEKEDPGSDPLYIADRDGGHPRMISLESRILQKIPKSFTNIRIYAASSTRGLQSVRNEILGRMNG